MALETTGALLADRYRVIRRLGAGGMAAVFLAEDQRLGRRVAVKRLHAGSPEDVGRRFEREARVGASLNHPNIVSVFDTVVDDEGVLIVMEYVDGETLRDEIARGPLSAERTLEVLRPIADALDHAHAHGVVHRDVGPSNVLIRRDGAVKLADLGIATAAEGTRITRSGTVLGTVAYMAPERLDGAPGGPSADVYALAAVAFEALTGEKAFGGRSAAEIARRAVLEPPPDLPGAPAAAAAALKAGMAKDPDGRPPTAGALVDALAHAYAPPQPVARPIAPPQPVARPIAPPRHETQRAARPAPATRRAGTRRRGRLALVLAAALIACAAALAVALTLANGGGSRRTAQRSAPPSRAAAPPSRAATPKTSAPSGGTGSTPAPAPSVAAASPSGTLVDFYTRGTRGDVLGAWALGTERVHAEVGGFDSFRAQEASLRSIAFPALTVTRSSADAATVSFRSVAVHTTRTDHCSGSATLVMRDGRWLVDELQGISCTS